MSIQKTPVIDLGCCNQCGVCIDVAPHVFKINDAGYVDILSLDSYEDDEDILEAVKNCPKDCISWE
ncbi:ferredoxin [Desulfobacter hydrogenophilus]|uniref:Ferredoxin n=1 Tax=Desulfobacter hydrogenophilus TaxID=2291 RepID=A0A328FJL3_9BACT|nr:ferredoxin [Desulfobacter hydrogenophilus]NDY70783.1 ferredoxin [Desulfobacter hydrogenophilus]QBH11556.1 ferredoxin [Desulfobacter hydrogenophilus]RAM03105.1 ferredoxin [Desulfobacter hydrogenophilus]